MPKSRPRYFFKVFFPDQSSNFLRIPPAFREHIEAGSSKQVSLKGPSGGIWKIKLVKNSDGYIFDDGWKGFVADQSLAMGDFLIFQYDGDSMFKVLVFDSTACEKETAFIAIPSVEEENVSVEENEESDEGVRMEEEEDEEENKPLVHFAKRRFEWILKKKMWINDPVNDNDHSKNKNKKKCFEFKMDQSNSKKSKLSSAHLSPSSRDLFTVKQECESDSPSGSNEYNRQPPTLQNEDAMHRNPAFSIRNRYLHKLYNGSPVSGSSPPTSKTKKFSNALEMMKSNETVYQRGSVFRVGALISQRRPVTEEEVGRTLARAMSFKSENPFAIAVMQDSYVYTSFFMILVSNIHIRSIFPISPKSRSCKCVPAWFVKEHLPQQNAVLTLWDPHGKPWQVNYIFYNTHGALSGGWGKFSYANNLEKYDACVFELIQKDHLKVHIYRVLEEITPLIRRRRVTKN